MLVVKEEDRSEVEQGVRFPLALARVWEGEVDSGRQKPKTYTKSISEMINQGKLSIYVDMYLSVNYFFLYSYLYFSCI